MDTWKPIRLEPGRSVEVRIGPLTLWLKRTQDELHVAADRVPEEDAAAAPGAEASAAPAGPENLAWARWVVGDDGAVVRLVPVMPDRPVVVRPETEVRIPPGREAMFFVSIPVWVRVVAGEGTGLVLGEEPSVLLSNIWFGDLMSGELGYSVTTRARRVVDETEVRPHRAVCPVHIQNAAAEPLPIERLCVSAPHLSVFDGGPRLWTNEVRVTAQGQDRSRIDYADGPPGGRGAGGLLSGPRAPVATGVLKRGFSSLKAFAGM